MSEDPVALVLTALAGWRLAYLLTNEDGPANVFGWLRRRVAGPMDRDIKPGSVDKLFSCVYCMSFWTVALVAYLWALDIDGLRYVVFFLAAWGAATALDMLARRE